MSWAAVCVKMKVLPYEGGLFDQSPFHVAVLETYINAVSEREQREIDEMKNKSPRR